MVVYDYNIVDEILKSQTVAIVQKGISGRNMSFLGASMVWVINWCETITILIITYVPICA